MAFQALLYHYVPGKTCHGQQTPGGNVLSYTTNGLPAFGITLALYVVASVSGLVRPTIIADHWEGLLMAANGYGIFLAAFALCKGYWAPSYSEDVKISGRDIRHYFSW